MTVASELQRLIDSKAAIKTAIENKGVTVDAALKIDSYAAKIDLISQGGGAGSGDYLVRFIDYDGTILKEQWVNSGQAATAPNLPAHELLTFDEWNNDFSNITGDLDVGATYRTTSGHTYLFLSFTVPHLLSYPVIVTKSTTDILNIYDNTSGTLLGTTSGTGNRMIDLTFAVGDYVIRIECAGMYYFQNNMFTRDSLKKGSITTAYFGNNITKYETNIFKECRNLRLVMLPKNTTTIGNGLFQGCSSLEGVIIPKGVVQLGEVMFDHCITIKNIVIPKETITNTQYIYGYCYNLTRIIAPKILSNNSNTFYNNYNLKHIKLPDDLSTIGYGMFYQCYVLETLIIPHSVNIIATSAFNGCQSLNHVTIPEGVSTLNDYCFSGCLSLKTIEIPINVTSIGAQCFNGCLSLKTIEIPINVTSIGALCFFGLQMMEYIIRPINPPTIANLVFANILPTCKIYVPDASVDAYKAATNWATYANYIFPISTRP